MDAAVVHRFASILASLPVKRALDQSSKADSLRSQAACPVGPARGSPLRRASRVPRRGPAWEGRARRPADMTREGVGQGRGRWAACWPAAESPRPMPSPAWKSGGVGGRPDVAKALGQALAVGVAASRSFGERTRVEVVHGLTQGEGQGLLKAVPVDHQARAAAHTPSLRRAAFTLATLKASGSKGERSEIAATLSTQVFVCS